MNIQVAHCRAIDEDDEGMRAKYLIIVALCNGGTLRGAKLSDANLSYANLRGANLSGANLSDANLSYANLRGANLSGAKLSDANLSYANLSGAKLSDANLSYANLRGANLSGAKLSDAKGLAQFVITPNGSLHVWKRLADGVIAHLLVPEAAARVNAYGSRKCRAEYVEVLGLIGGTRGVSKHDARTAYEVGKIVRPDAYDPDPRVECSSGIHFFITRAEAEAY